MLELPKVDRGREPMFPIYLTEKDGVCHIVELDWPLCIGRHCLSIYTFLADLSIVQTLRLISFQYLWIVVFMSKSLIKLCRD